MELENKLAAYRAKRNREELVEKIKEKAKKVFHWNIDKVPQQQTELLINNEPIEEPEISENPKIIEEEPQETEEIKPIPTTYLTYSLYCLGFIIWVYFYCLFIKLQFGIIYLIVSALFGIYFNTRTGPKDKNEVSAYSVFNKDCKSIDGTLTAEQFEREIRFGAQSVH